MSRRIGVGIIGCGAIANNHAINYAKSKECKLVAVADIIEERAKEFSKRFGVKTWYANYHDLLKRSDIDAVSICLPHHLHADTSIVAAEMGKHILCEKPLAIDLKQVDAIIRAVRKARVKLAVAFQSRFHRIIQRAKEEIDKGTIGILILGDLQYKSFRTQEYYESEIWRGKRDMGGGGVLMNQAIHAIDLFQMFMGCPKTLIGKIETKTHKIEVEDTGVTMLTFKNGALGVIEASTSICPGFPTRLNIHGTEGSVLIERNHCTLATLKGKEEWIEEEWPDLPTPPFVNPKEHELIIGDFLSAIAEDREPEVNGEEARKSVELVRAIYASSDNGKPYIFER